MDANRVTFDSRDFRQTLLPVLLAGEAAQLRDDDQWGPARVEQVQGKLVTFFPLLPHEQAFVTGIREHGTIDGALLTSDSELATCIERQPMLLWRVLQCERTRRGKAPRAL